VEVLCCHKDDLWEVLVGMDKQVSKLARGQEELGDRVVWVEQRGWSPDTWTVVEDESVADEEDKAEMDAMEEREGVLDEAEAWVQAHPMQAIIPVQKIYLFKVLNLGTVRVKVLCLLLVL
jgi:hypothetical protein